MEFFLLYMACPFCLTSRGWAMVKVIAGKRLAWLPPMIELAIDVWLMRMGGCAVPPMFRFAGIAGALDM